ncbi:DUF4238 domain-containing protein [Paenibacillus lautus]|uniref:DUF4238 domain-containing protein n=1 Tax=Paenibacillus lautus TaxID=1401 RepID=UPI00385069E3
MSEAIYHHLVPRTYLKSWCHHGYSAHAYKSEGEKFKNGVNVSSHFGYNHYHSLRVGMSYLNEEDLSQIFKELSNFQVKYEGRNLEGLKEWNEKFFDRENWELIYPNGKLVPKKRRNALFQSIEHAALPVIEMGWSIKYENKWNKLLRIIEQKVLVEEEDTEIPEFYKGFIMKMIVSIGWRSERSREIYTEVLNQIDNVVNLSQIVIDRKDNLLPFGNNVLDVIRHEYLLKEYRNFLNETGVIYMEAKEYIRRCSLTFFVATGECRFITSDNPSFIRSDSNFKVPTMPVSPQVLVEVGVDREKRGTYQIRRIDDIMVKQYNKIILDNSERMVLSLSPDLEIMGL